MFMIPLKHETVVRGRDDDREFGRGYDRFLHALSTGVLAPDGEYAPSLDVKETKDAYTVLADLPGLDRKDIQVSLEEGLLTISGSRKAEHEESSEDRTWHRVERSWGSFSRTLRLGEGVDADKVSAEYKDGVLTVAVPKKESAQPRRVDVK